MNKKLSGMLTLARTNRKRGAIDGSLTIPQFFMVVSVLIYVSSGSAEIIKNTGKQIPIVEQHGPHQHGAANLTIAVNANNLEINLESPADNIFGFEYLPSTEDDKKKVKDAVEQLKTAKELFTIPEEAQCHLDQVNVSSVILESFFANININEISKQDHAHNDIDASWFYTCRSGKYLKYITPHFFTIFSSGFKQLKVEWLTPKGASTILLKEDKTIQLKEATE